MNKEEWVKSYIYGSKYEVSSNGRIRRILKSSKKILNPYKSKKGYTKCSLSSNGVVKCVEMQRLVFISFNGDTDLFIDHINGNPSDNRLCNLRSVDHKQSSRNRGSSTGRSKYKGVYWRKRGVWESYIQIEKGNRPYLGCFKNEEDAARAYNKRCKEEFGNYARLNIINGE